LVLEGINPSAVGLVRNGNHLTLVIAESTPGAGDGVQQHGVLTLLRLVKQANHGRVTPPSGKSGECRFR
jgi:hypothetical protein